METTTAASNNPFAGRNGADLFAQFERDHDPEDVDFGPETDVDMVDDVLLSPTIAAAKKLALEDELELQRQQMKEFDDPEDLERSRDTPTPPAHEVASNAIIEPLGDSGEESEEEWNYIPGQDRKPSDNQDEEDMSSQLNPDAAEFVPVSPTKLLMFEDDAIISASSYDKSNTSIDDVQLPSEMEFGVEIKQRPGDLEFTNGPRQDDYFMRDNFSTLRNKDNFVNVPTTCAELESSIMGLKPNGLATHLDDVPFDELEAVKDMEDKENTKETNEFTSNFGAAGIFGKGDPMTTSVVGFASSSEHEIEDIVIPDTPKSTTVEAPVSPNLSNEDESPVHQEDLDKSPVDKSASNENKPSELLAFEDNLQDGLTSGQERTSTSEFESESGAAENALEDNEGFITEHRRSPPIDLSFKPIQNFSDTNPFGALQTPGSTITPMSLANVISNEENSEPSPDALKEHDSFIARFSDNIDIVHDTPTSFISLRSPGVNDVPVPFDELESPREELQFQPPPSADTSLLAEELPKSEKIELDLQETIAELTDLSKNSPTTNEALDNSPGFEVSKIIPYELESQMNEEVLVLTASSEPDQPSENTHEVVVPQQVLSPSEPDQPSENTHEVVVPQQVLSPFDEFEHQEEKSTEVKQEADLELETKEMKLEFESHITNPIENSENTPNELKNIDDTFEVIMKEELILDGQISQNEPSMPKEASVDLISPTQQTNPFAMNDNFSENLLDAQTESVNSKNDFISAIDKFDSVLGDEACHSEQTTLLSASAEVIPPVEPEATKVVSYQTLTPAEEPMLSKTEAYMTEVEDVSVEKPTDVVESPIENEIASADIQPTVSVLDELTPTKSEPVESQVVTETLITALEEKSEVPPPITTEVPSSIGTPPPTPAPGVDGESDVQKADILVAAVAAAGAVAAGAAVIADKEVKKASAVPAKKPAAGVAKKPEPATKAPAKTVPAKTTAAKPAAAKTTTTKPTSAATKPSSATGAAKTAPAKPALAPAAAKKPTPTSPLKPGAAKPATVSTAASKPVPKQLPVNKTSATTLKTSSKPTTPTSKPTTPTTPKVPSVLKSPPKPATKSTLATSRPSPGAAKPLGATEKKPLTNGDIKPLAKKPEDATKKPLTSVAKSAAAATRPTAPATKTTAAPAKAPLSAASKTAPAKPAMASQPKPKTLTTTTTTKTTVPPIKRPSTAAPTKPTEKTGKEAVTKASSNVKPAVNGKTAPAKPTVVKKTDAKVNGKAAPGKPVPKKTEEVKKEEEQEIKIQVDSVTTTNGFAEHIIEENGTMKIEELDQIVVEGVN